MVATVWKEQAQTMVEREGARDGVGSLRRVRKM